jgi:hypothetical protein
MRQNIVAGGALTSGQQLGQLRSAHPTPSLYMRICFTLHV